MLLSSDLERETKHLSFSLIELKEMLEFYFLLECCNCALFDEGVVKSYLAEEATGVFLELSRRHAPGGEQLHGRPLLCLSD